jgi:hypothetical protein
MLGFRPLASAEEIAARVERFDRDPSGTFGPSGAESLEED